MIEKDGPFSCQMYECIEKGNFKKVPLIIGFNSEEKLTSGKLLQHFVAII